MASRKTWIWIVAGTLGVGLAVLIGLAGLGVYFVTQHVHSEETSGPDAMQAFAAVTAMFGDARPLYELDADGNPHTTATLSDLPASPTPPEDLWLLAWDPDKGRLVRLSMPFWLLRIGRQKMHVSEGPGAWEFQRLELDVTELERIGPALVFDYRDEHGVRVLLWTQ